MGIHSKQYYKYYMYTIDRVYKLVHNKVHGDEYFITYLCHSPSHPSKGDNWEFDSIVFSVT